MNSVRLGLKAVEVLRLAQALDRVGSLDSLEAHSLVAQKRLHSLRVLEEDSAVLEEVDLTLRIRRKYSRE